MGTSIDVDPATWVRNKLGTDDLWNYGNVANLLNSEIVNGVEEHFQSFDVKIKLKFLLSFLQIPRRNIEGLSDDLTRIIQLAEMDGDDWVKVVASMLKEYPRTALVNFDIAADSNTFKQTVEDIGVSVENCTGTGTLPMECPYLNRTALNHLVGQQQGPTKHFTLRRKPKSAALRAQLTQRASEMASHKKSVTGQGGTPHHAGQKRPLSAGAQRDGAKSFSASPAKVPGARSTPVIPPVRNSLRATGSSLKKTKLLDITEQPVAGREAKKKKKAQEAEAAAAEAKLNKTVEQQQASNQQQNEEGKKEDTSNTPKVETKTQESTEEKEAASNESQEPSIPVTTPSYAVLPGAAPQPSYAPPVPTNTTEDRSGALRIDPNATTASKNLQRELQIRVRQQQLQLQQQQQQQQTQPQTQPQPLQQPQQPNQPQASTEAQPAPQFRQLTTGAQELNPPLRNDQITRPEITVPSLNPFGHAGAHLKHYRIQGAATQSLSSPTNQVPAAQPPQQPPTPAVTPRPTLSNKKGLSLTREQMLAAQEMFRSANKVTRAEKALILGFMAGARENPFPQQGPVITIKLSEEKANMPQADGTAQMVLVEMLFEMNYDTGHWRRLKRTRVLAPATSEDASAPSFQ